MDTHYHMEDGALREVNMHRTVCPVCHPAPVAVEAPKAVDVPVTPIRRPHRKVVTPPEAA